MGTLLINYVPCGYLFRTYSKLSAMNLFQPAGFIANTSFPILTVLNMRFNLN